MKPRRIHITLDYYGVHIGWPFKIETDPQGDFVTLGNHPDGRPVVYRLDRSRIEPMLSDEEEHLRYTGIVCFRDIVGGPPGNVGGVRFDVPGH